MARWDVFASGAPEIAASASRLVTSHAGLVYLATVRANGTPQVHPVHLWRWDGRAWMFIVEISAKYGDLVRSGRFALHTARDDSPENVEVHLEGSAIPCEDPGIRQEVASLAGGPKAAWELLFEIDIDRATQVSWTGWGTPAARPSFVRWREQA